METHDNKKMLIPMISGVLFMICLVVGATYAYFTLNFQNSFTETKISSEIDDVGSVSLLPDVDEMSLSLTVDNMAQQTGDVAYYGTKNGTVMQESSEVLAKASVSGEGLFNCTYDLTMTASGTNNLYNIVQNMEGDKTGHVILTVNGVRYDFGEPNLFPKTIKGSINGLTEGVTQDITAQIMVVNKSSQDQNVLMGTDIEITFKMNNFKCDMTEMGNAGKYVMDTNPTNISTDLVEGLYRFQGTNDEVTNNYICVGANDKNTCLSDSFYLQRLIGITPNGELKVMFGQPIGAGYWHENSNENVSWPYSDLFQNFQQAEGAEVELMVDKEWKYDSIGMERVLELAAITDEATLMSELIKLESTYKNVIVGKIGLITLRDLLLHDKCYLNNPNDCNNGWMLLKNADSSYSSEREWLMERPFYDNGVNYAIVIGADDAGIDYLKTSSTAYIRPVFYLPENLELSGTGTITDPYIINY